MSDAMTFYSCDKNDLPDWWSPSTDRYRSRDYQLGSAAAEAL